MKLILLLTILVSFPFESYASHEDLAHEQGAFKRIRFYVGERFKAINKPSVIAKFEQDETFLTTEVNRIQASFLTNDVWGVWNSYEGFIAEPARAERAFTGLTSPNFNKDQLISALPLERLQRAKGGKVDRLGGSLFYPFPFMVEQGQTSFQDLNQAMRLGVLIAAFHGNRQAQRIIVSSTEEGTSLNRNIAEVCLLQKKVLGSFKEESVLSFLKTPFVLNNRLILEQMKHVKVDELVRHKKFSEEYSSVVDLNLGYLMLRRANYEEALSWFKKAGQKGLDRGYIEIGLVYLGKPSQEIPIEEVFQTFNQAQAYGLWKIAECYRYGKGVALNLSEANNYYKKALNQQYNKFLRGDIYYDYGTFCEHLAFGCSSEQQPLKIQLLKLAYENFVLAGKDGRASGYGKAANLIMNQCLRLNNNWFDTLEEAKKSAVQFYQDALLSGYRQSVLENLITLGLEENALQEMAHQDQTMQGNINKLLSSILKAE